MVVKLLLKRIFFVNAFVSGQEEIISQILLFQHLYKEYFLKRKLFPYVSYNGVSNNFLIISTI